jgi:hypothetical protein
MPTLDIGLWPRNLSNRNDLLLAAAQVKKRQDLHKCAADAENRVAFLDGMRRVAELPVKAACRARWKTRDSGPFIMFN